MRIKKILLQIFLMAEMATLGYVYFFGKNGLNSLQQARNEIKNIGQKIAILKDEIIHLEQKIVEWESDDFYKEKVAREQLHMARRDEEIFYIG